MLCVASLTDVVIDVVTEDTREKIRTSPFMIRPAENALRAGTLHLSVIQKLALQGRHNSYLQNNCPVQDSRIRGQVESKCDAKS